jgi:hypothetical protein
MFWLLWSVDFFSRNKIMSKSLKRLIGAVAMGVSALVGSAHGENWIPISSGDMLIFIPQINFQAQQQTAGQYQLSWNELSGATSYTIERQTADTSVAPSGGVLPTYWKFVSETTNTSLSVSNSILDIDLGGSQTYRLSSCDLGICTVADTVTYELNLENLSNAIPQGVLVTVVPPPPPTANLTKNRALFGAVQQDGLCGLRRTAQ